MAEDSGPLSGLLRPYQRWRSRRDFLKEAREYHQERDPVENAETRLPDGEKIELHSIWVAEIYPPSFVPSLLSGLHELKWDTGHSIAIEELDVADWVNQSRASAFGGGWLNLGNLARPGDRKYFGVRRAPLPAGVKFATATVHSPVPSLTACVVQFVLDDATKSRLHAVLNSDYESKIEQVGNKQRIHSPRNLKQEALKTARREIRDTCAEWFRQNLPGTFSSGLRGRLFPTLEFITTTVAQPFRGDTTQHVFYTWALNLDWETEAWVDLETPELVLQMPHESFDDVTALALAGRKGDILARENDFRGLGEGDARLDHWLTDRVDGDLVLWALQQMLLGHQEDLGELRDAVRTQTRSPAEAVTRLERIQAALLATTVDAEIAAAELIAAYEREHWRPYNATDFEPMWDVRRKHQDSWIKFSRSGTIALATNVLATQRQVQNMLSAEGNIVGAITNLRIQRVLIWLTVFVAVLTVLALGIATLQVWLALND